MSDAACRWFVVGTRHLGLTPRQAEAVWWRITEGCPERAIGARMCVAPVTARNLVYQAYRRIGLPPGTSSAASAVRLWPYVTTARLLARFGPPGAAA
jgi:DNA-binding CsgD family transcriptional regulator